MAPAASTSTLTSKPLNGLLNSPKPQQPNLSFFPIRASSCSFKKSPSSPTRNPSPEWTVDSWKSKKAHEQPEYPNPKELDWVVKTLESFPPIVLAGEARRLEERIGEAARGNAFLLLQGGDYYYCAADESFKEFNANNIMDTFKLLLQMSVVLMFVAQLPIIKVGRMGGQFAKTRSEKRVKLLSYRNDNINNGDFFEEKARILNPRRMIRAYTQLVATLNLLRAFATEGYTAMKRVTHWNLDFTNHSQQRDRYFELAQRVDEAVGFMAAVGLTSDHPIMTSTVGLEFWTSHKCLLLPYEQALTREYSNYACIMRGIANPIGIKVSEKMNPNELVKLIDILNPENKPGRVTVISRMGAENVRLKLPHLIRAVHHVGQIVTWVSDPMHGNTIKAHSGLKKCCSFDSIWAKLEAFFDVHDQEGCHAGGVHLEMTGQHMNECVRGGHTITYDDLSSGYDHTHFDARLNASQSLELAFNIADRLRMIRYIEYN